MEISGASVIRQGGRTSTGTGTKFVTYLSPSPMLFKHEKDIFWPIMNNKETNNEYSLYFM